LKIIIGPIIACAYPLGEIDTYRTPGEDRLPTALELVVYLSGEAGNDDEVFYFHFQFFIYFYTSFSYSSFFILIYFFIEFFFIDYPLKLERT